MKKFMLSVLGIYLICCVCSFAIDKYLGNKLPSIALPEAAHHNTIGELPIVEMADDGVFAEEDGVEDRFKTYSDCVHHQWKDCENIKKDGLDVGTAMNYVYCRDGVMDYCEDLFKDSFAQDCIKRMKNICGYTQETEEKKNECLEALSYECKNNSRRGYLSCATQDVYGALYTCWGSFK